MQGRSPRSVSESSAAIVYVMLRTGGSIRLSGWTPKVIADTVVRIAMGGLLGYVLYIAGTIDVDSGHRATVWCGRRKQAGLETAAAAVGGYSITLVVGILSKAVAAFQLTFNIDEKGANGTSKIVERSLFRKKATATPPRCCSPYNPNAPSVPETFRVRCDMHGLQFRRRARLRHYSNYRRRKTTRAAGTPISSTTK